MAMLALRPVAVEFVDTLMHDPDTDLLLEELEVRSDSPLVGKSIEAGLVVRAIQSKHALAERLPGVLDVDLAGRREHAIV